MEYMAKADDKELIIDEVNKKWIVCDKKEKKDGSVAKKYKVLPMELADFIKKNLKYIFVKTAASEQPLIYVYTNGYYKFISDDEMRGFIKSFIPYQLRYSKDINEILYELKTEMNFVEYEDLNNNEDIINFQDGLYNIKTNELLPHNPDVLSTIQIPAKYNDIKNAPKEAPVFYKYMMKLCNGDFEVFELLLQCLGIVMSNVYAYRTKKSLFLVGPGNTGKSQLKKLAEYLIGYNNVSNIDLKKVNDKHGTASLYQKRLAGCNDMSYQRIEDMSIFKQLTGGDAIEIDFKFKNSFNFLFKGFLWFNCNKLPRFGGDTGKWVYERIMPVFCNNVVTKEEQDPKLFEKMLDEKNTILLMALQALQKVVKNNYHFSEPKILEQKRKEYEKENNTLLNFIEECCYIKEDTMPSLRLRRSIFKEAYDRYIKMNCNGRGKLTTLDMNTVLENNFGESFIKSNGIWYMSKILLLPETKEELGLYEYNEKIL